MLWCGDFSQVTRGGPRRAGGFLWNLAGNPLLLCPCRQAGPGKAGASHRHSKACGVSAFLAARGWLESLHFQTDEFHIPGAGGKELFHGDELERCGNDAIGDNGASVLPVGWGAGGALGDGGPSG